MLNLWDDGIHLDENWKKLEWGIAGLEIRGLGDWMTAELGDWGVSELGD